MSYSHALYEKKSLWNWNFLESPYYRTKAHLIQGMIPAGVRTIFDLGSGNGAITNELCPPYWVVGGDRSWTALGYLQVHSVQLSADFLPFRDRSFDLVMSHQTLEHLPESVFLHATHELMRVTERYLFISVPYQDQIAQQRACCGMCGHKYNVWGHLRAFNRVSDFRRLFPEFKLQSYTFCGPENEYMTRFGRWLYQWGGGGWVVDPNAVCPRCGSEKQFQAGFPRRVIAAAAARLDRLLPKRKAFWWLLCLFERME